MDFIKITNINKTIIFLYFFLLINLSESIINNPQNLYISSNPHVFKTNELLIIYTSGYKHIKNIQTGNVSLSYICPYSYPSILIKEDSENYQLYLYSNNTIYSLANSFTTPYYYNEYCNYESERFSYFEFPKSSIFVDYISETAFSPATHYKFSSNPELTELRCQTLEKEIIIYGKKDSYHASFGFIKRNETIDISFTCQVEDYMKCNKIINSVYICVFICNNRIFINLYIYGTEEIEYKLYPSICKFELYETKDVNFMNKHNNVRMFDTNEDNEKLICAKNKDTKNMDCFIINYFFNDIEEELVERTNIIEKEGEEEDEIEITREYEIHDYNFTLLFEEEINFSLELDDEKSNNHCVFKESIEDEYLLCCGGTNIITCGRIDNDYNLINSFTLNINGNNTYLDILMDYPKINIIYMNSNNDINKTCQYTIIIPSCPYKTFNTIPISSFNDNLYNLIQQEMNSNYYILFTEIPSDYGNLTIDTVEYGNILGEILVDNTTSKIPVDSYKILTFDAGEDTIQNFQIKYIISLDETFSSECSATLNINDCYESCQFCTKPAYESNSTEHNCMPNSCKELYYLDPTIDTNCWAESEKKSNWYLDYTNRKYGLCHNKCATCDGPSETDCRSCKSNTEFKYLANKKCDNKCPDGFYAKLLTSLGYYDCKPCYQNCATCSDEGNHNTMRCDSCKENYIKFQNYCYEEHNSTQKTFYDPENHNIITSCKGSLGLYIIENTYECVFQVTDESYFLEYPTTGLYAKCDSACRSCNGRKTDTNTNCLTCANEDLNFHLGNCIENCPIGYYSLEKREKKEQKKCVRCYTNCLSCEQGEERDSILVSKMNCLQCKKDENGNEINIQINDNCFTILEYTEEKITFDVSRTIHYSEGQYIKTCLHFGLSIYYGQYQCITKPTHTYYVLTNEENSGVIKDCDVACQTCFGAPNPDGSDTNCDKCNEGYFKTEDSETNCIFEDDISNNYYKNLEDRIYYKCFDNCETCERQLEHKADINNMGCKTCIDNYHLVKGTQNCFDDTFLENNINYFYSSDDEQFHKCYYSCKRCSADGTDGNNQNCDECIDNYYFEDNTKNCYDSSYTENGFYLDIYTINTESNELPKFKACHEACKTCTKNLIDEDMNCITCIDGYFRKVDTNNCLTDITNKRLYSKGDIAYPCEDNCYTCSNGVEELTENNYDNNNNLITNITYNCLSCDSSNNLFLVEVINNCETIDFKERGFYLKEEPDGTKIFHKCYQSCSLCEKGFELDSDNNEIHNCDECADNYYRAINYGNEKNCYGDEMKEEGYLLVRNKWQICHENCDLCSSGPTYDDETHTIIISENCVTCYEGFRPIYQTSNCANESYLEKGYFYDDEINVYKPCDISCISCEKNSVENDPKCIKCNNAREYYNAENKPTQICYNSTTKDPLHVLSERIDENGNKYKIYSLCYRTCLTCDYYGNDNDHGCSKCISRHSFIYNTKNCITQEEAEITGYYFNRTYNQYVKCDISCNNCKTISTNCEDCNYNEGYYPIEDKSNRICYNNKTIEEGYFLNIFDNGLPKWKSCYENCATCEYRGTKYRMNCYSCRTNLKNKFNKNKYFLFIDSNCIESCPNNLFLTKDGDCVSNCPSGTYHFQLDYNYSCVDFCPDKYIISTDGKKCVLPEFQKYINSTEFKSIISADITSYVNSSRIIDLDNLQAEIIYSNNLKDQSTINHKFTTISNLDNSLIKIKQKFNIPNDENLIIVIIETKENKEINANLDRNKDLINLGKDIELIIYDNLGRKLDLSKCEDVQILVTKNIADLPYINFYKAKDLYQKGIDVFNESDPFFNDICYPFKTNSSSDIILADRRSDLFVNISFCDSGCIYDGIDYQLMVVNCICYIDSINNDNAEEYKGIILNNNQNKFPKELHNSNIILLKCSNLAFNTEILKNNVGFYFSLISFTFEVAFLVVFAKNGLKSIKNFMLIFAISNPPKLKDILSIAEGKKNKNKNIKEEEIKETILINHLLNRRTSIKTMKKEKNEIDDALVVKYTQSENDDFYSNRKALNNKKNKNEEDEKESISDSESESDSESKKEKRTKITRKKLDRKKTDKRNNLVLPKTKVNEKPNYKNEENKKNIHPMDMDTLSISKKKEKDKYRKNIVESSDSNSENNYKKSDDYEEKIKRKKKGNAKDDNEKKSKLSKKKKEKNTKNKEQEYMQRAIISYRNKDRKISTKITNQKNITSNTLTSEELSLMEYEEAIKNDKRGWSQIYYAYLIDKNFFCNTFISESFINLRSIKINLFCFRLEVIFVFNALFYTDKYISKAYYNNGKLEIFTSLPKALYSFLVSLLATIIFKFFTNNKKEVYKIIKEKDEKIEYNDLIKIVLKTIKIKFIIFFVLQIIFSFIFFYYVTAFCAVYQNSNLYWLYGCLETLLKDVIIPFLYCLLLASLRHFGIYKRIKFFYNIGNILDIIL